MMTSLSQRKEKQHDEETLSIRSLKQGDETNFPPTYVFKPLITESEPRSSESKTISRALTYGHKDSLKKRRRSFDSGQYLNRRRICEGRVLSAGGNKNVVRYQDFGKKLSSGRSSDNILHDLETCIRKRLHHHSGSSSKPLKSDIKLSLISLRSNDETVTSLVSVDTSKKTKGKLCIRFHL